MTTALDPCSGDWNEPCSEPVFDLDNLPGTDDIELHDRHLLLRTTVLLAMVYQNITRRLAASRFVVDSLEQQTLR